MSDLGEFISLKDKLARFDVERLSPTPGLDSEAVGGGGGNDDFGDSGGERCDSMHGACGECSDDEADGVSDP